MMFGVALVGTYGSDSGRRFTDLLARRPTTVGLRSRLRAGASASAIGGSGCELDGDAESGGMIIRASSSSSKSVFAR
jgi:hypothetical protein